MPPPRAPRLPTFKAKFFPSHTILIIDNSGSMRTPDVWVDTDGDRITRHEAVFDALVNGVFLPQDKNQTKDDVVTMVRLGDDAGIIFDAIPFGDAAKVCAKPDFVDGMLPRSHGRYVPALNTLQVVLSATASRRTNVLFFSDGKPSDNTPLGSGSGVEKVRNLIVDRTRMVCARQKNFTFHTVGFGLDDFSTLKAMAAGLPSKQGVFHNSGLNLRALTSTMSSFSDSISHLRLSVSQGPQRALVPVQVSKHSDTWIRHKDVRVWHAPPSLESEFKEHPTKWTVRVSEKPFDRGGERNVFDLRFETNLDDEWVAKRDRHIVSNHSDDVDFHRKHLVTQAVAQDWAERFSATTKVLGYPTIQFLNCWLMQLTNGFVFAEKKLQGKYTKWNSNHGTYKRVSSTTQVLQAFSHYTHHKSHGKLLVCDLQGIFDRAKDTFTLVDPVIHYSSSNKRHQYGRTDRGLEGMEDFFRSHECTEACIAFGLPHNDKYIADCVNDEVTFDTFATDATLTTMMSALTVRHRVPSVRLPVYVSPTYA